MKNAGRHLKISGTDTGQIKGCGTFTTRNLAPNDIKRIVDEANKISHNLGAESGSSFTHDLHRGLCFHYIMAGLCATARMRACLWSCGHGRTKI